MAISDNDYKVLWGRAAGLCSNPGCKTDLTILLENEAVFNVGEMAHIVAKSEAGPRGQAGGGSDSYENLVLLCPTCHRRVDKAPAGEYPEELLFSWKAAHEAEIRSIGQALKFSQFSDLRRSVSPKLLENKIIWEKWGPSSRVADLTPDSNSYKIWDLRKLSTIVPNNRFIVNVIGTNIDILSDKQTESYLIFKDHAEGFERNQYGRLDHYTLFPESFGREFGNG